MSASVMTPGHYALGRLVPHPSNSEANSGLQVLLYLPQLSYTNTYL